jgi:hypothetical protein
MKVGVNVGDKTGSVAFGFSSDYILEQYRRLNEIDWFGVWDRGSEAGEEDEDIDDREYDRIDEARQQSV